jgi:hypothetical protein
MSVVLVLVGGGLVDLVSREGLVVSTGPSHTARTCAGGCLINAIDGRLSRNRPQAGVADVGHGACRSR